MLYLASQSPRRRTLLQRLGRPFRVVRSAYRETIRRGEPPAAAAMRNAAGKARSAHLPPRAKGIVIGADTFLYFRGRVIGKPRSLAAARRFLRTLSGRSHWVYTGLCLYHPATGRARASYEKTRVTFKQLTPETIRRLFRRAHPLDKAGGYALQADHGELIARIDGSRTNVVGLPLELLRRELRAFGKSVAHSGGAGPVRAVLRRSARPAPPWPAFARPPGLARPSLRSGHHGRSALRTSGSAPALPPAPLLPTRAAAGDAEAGSLRPPAGPG